ADAAGAPGGTVDVLRAAAYGEAMRSGTGDCAGRLSDLASALFPSDLEGWDGKLLGLATSIRGALFAPFSGATRLLEDLGPAFATWPALAGLAEVVHQGALRGVQLVNASDADMASVASIEADIADTVELAEESLRAGPTRTIKFQRATEIWHEWISRT